VTAFTIFLQLLESLELGLAKAKRAILLKILQPHQEHLNIYLKLSLMSTKPAEKVLASTKADKLVSIY
jgi:hypothetical protein